MRVTFLAVLVSIVFGCPAWPQDTRTSEAGAERVSSAGDRGPVVLPEPSPEAVRYYHTGNAWWAFGQVWSILVPGVILFTGLSARIRALAARLGRYWYFTVAIYFVLYSVLTFAVDFPIDFFRDFRRQHAYGLSNQTLAKWLADSFITLAIGTIIIVAFFWVPYLLVKKSPRRWWLYTALLVIPFVTFMQLIYPVWIAPLYNNFGPMKDKALETKILHLAKRAGIDGSRVYEVEKSVDTKMYNAYVAGFAGTKRIVLWDTIINRLETDELMVVMAHEMAHYILGHIIKGIAVVSGLIIVGLLVAHLASGPLIARFQDRFGFRELSDVASFPLVIILFQATSFALVPAFLAYSRHIEREADRFGLELVQNNRAAAQAFVKLSVENLAYPAPGPIYTMFRASHPSIAERVEFCNTYRPWETGEPLRYGRYFDSAEAALPPGSR